MIIAIAGRGADTAATVLANLAVLRARSGRKVVLIDGGARRRAGAWSHERSAAGVRPWLATRTLAGKDMATALGALSLHYHDIVIDTEARDTPASRAALGAARLAIVPVQAELADLASQHQLLACLSDARERNPALRVLLVVVTRQAEAAAEELAAARAYAARVGPATLAATVIHAPAQPLYGAGRCVCDAETCDPALAAEMHALYREVYASAP